MIALAYATMHSYICIAIATINDSIPKDIMWLPLAEQSKIPFSYHFIHSNFCGIINLII